MITLSKDSTIATAIVVALSHNSKKVSVTLRAILCSKEINNDKFCYCQVGRAITIHGAIEQCPIMLSQY